MYTQHSRELGRKTTKIELILDYIDQRERRKRNKGKRNNRENRKEGGWLVVANPV